MSQTQSEPSSVGRICRPPFLGMCVLTMAVLLPLIADDYWLKGVLIPALVFSLAALGLNLVTGFAGLISVGQSAFMAIGAFIAVITYARYDLPLLVCMILGGSAASAAGAIVGLPALRIRGFYLMTATLAAQFIVTWTIQHVPWFGARSFGTVNTPPVSIGAWHIGTATEPILSYVADRCAAHDICVEPCQQPYRPCLDCHSRTRDCRSGSRHSDGSAIRSWLSPRLLSTAAFPDRSSYLPGWVPPTFRSLVSIFRSRFLEW